MLEDSPYKVEKAMIKVLKKDPKNKKWFYKLLDYEKPWPERKKRVNKIAKIMLKHLPNDPEIISFGFDLKMEATDIVRLLKNLLQFQIGFKVTPQYYKLL